MNTLKKISLAARLKTLAVTLALAVCSGLSSAKAAEIRSYSGSLGGDYIELAIVWDSGKIFGEMKYKGQILHLEGTNPHQGFIKFTDSDGDVYKLTKRLTDGVIVWSGAMNDSVPVLFGRYR